MEKNNITPYILCIGKNAIGDFYFGKILTNDSDKIVYPIEFLGAKKKKLFGKKYYAYRVCLPNNKSVKYYKEDKREQAVTEVAYEFINNFLYASVNERGIQIKYNF